MPSLKNVCASCIHLFAVGSSILLFSIAYNRNYECLDIFRPYLAFNQALTPSIYLKSYSITIKKLFKHILLLLLPNILCNLVGACVCSNLTNECADDQYHTW